MSHGDLDKGLHITAGSGIVARVGGFAAFAAGDDEGLHQLIVRLNALADAAWPEVVRTITSDIAAAGYSAHPTLACASVDDDRVRALVFGDLQLLVETDSERQVLDGADSSTWIDVAVRGRVERLQCGERTPGAVTGVLRDGVVPGGGFLFDARSPIPAAVDWSPMTAQPVPEEPAREEPAPAEPVRAEPAAQQPEPARQPSPVEPEPRRTPAHAAPTDVAEVVDVTDVDGETSEAEEDRSDVADIRSLHELVSSIDRATAETLEPQPQRAPERSMFARDDSIDLAEEERIQQSDPPHVLTRERPSIGKLTFDDGASLELTRPVVIGRGVPERYTVEGEPATTVLLDDTMGMISSVHLEVRLRGNSVELFDKHSETGTFIHPARTGERIRLEPEVPTIIAPDTLVEVGQRSFTFTEPRRL